VRHFDTPALILNPDGDYHEHTERRLGVPPQNRPWGSQAPSFVRVPVGDLLAG
jgi:hypothetical protein